MGRGTITWHSQIDRDLPRRAAVIRRWIGAHGCDDRSIQLSCDLPVIPVAKGPKAKKVKSPSLTCAGQQLVVCTARRRQTGGDRQHHNCAAQQKESLWDLLPPLNVTDSWSTETLAAYAHGRLDVATEGDSRKATARRSGPRILRP